MVINFLNLILIMKFKNFLIAIVVLVILKVLFDKCMEKYDDLELCAGPSIVPNDLPEEFSFLAFKTVDEFVRKTKNLDYEYLIYFDYCTGEILKCFGGIEDNVVAEYDIDEFKGKHVASLHNHPRDVFSPPSGKNFGILLRDFEDYELIAGYDCLWILKAKGVDIGLNVELKVYADLLLDSCQEFCRKKYGDNSKAYDVCDIIYGVMLSNYLNDKNINHIQLTKMEYKP